MLVGTYGSLKLKKGSYSHKSTDMIGIRFSIPITKEDKMVGFNWTVEGEKGYLDKDTSKGSAVVSVLKTGIELSVCPIQNIRAYIGANIGYLGSNKKIDDTSSSGGMLIDGRVGTEFRFYNAAIGISYEYGTSKIGGKGYNLQETTLYLGYAF